MKNKNSTDLGIPGAAVVKKVTCQLSISATWVWLLPGVTYFKKWPLSVHKMISICKTHTIKIEKNYCLWNNCSLNFEKCSGSNFSKFGKPNWIHFLFKYRFKIIINFLSTQLWPKQLLLYPRAFDNWVEIHFAVKNRLIFWLKSISIYNIYGYTDVCFFVFGMWGRG